MSRSTSGMASGIVSGMALSTEDKVRENRLRRMADRQGVKLKRSATRDPLAIDYGVYWITDAAGEIVYGDAGGRPLDDVESWLSVGGSRGR